MQCEAHRAIDAAVFGGIYKGRFLSDEVSLCNL